MRDLSTSKTKGNITTNIRASKASRYALSDAAKQAIAGKKTKIVASDLHDALTGRAKASRIPQPPCLCHTLTYNPKYPCKQVRTACSHAFIGCAATGQLSNHLVYGLFRAVALPTRCALHPPYRDSQYPPQQSVTKTSSISHISPSAKTDVSTCETGGFPREAC